MSKSVEKAKYTSPEGSKKWEYLSILTCGWMLTGLGCAVGWNSPSIVILMADDSPIPVTESSISTMTAALAVGQLLASPLNIILADKFGRKNTILLTSIPFLINWGLIAIATSIWELYVARFLAGFGVGMLVNVEPMYIGEISSSKTRGAADSVTVMVYNVAVLMTFVVAPQLSLSFMAVVFFINNFASMVTFWFMPESPYFLALRNRMDEAEEVLEKLRGKPDVSDEMQVIIACVSKKDKGVAKSGTIKDVFSSRGHFRAFVIVLLFSTSQHFGGFFIILVYGQLIFKSTSNIASDYTVGVTIGVTQVISAIVTTVLIDKLGRKTLILVSGIIAALCDLVIGTFFYANEHTSIDVQMYSWVPFIASILLVFSFSSGLFSVQFTLLAEIFATEVKAICTCLLGIISGLEGIVGFKLYIWVAITLGYGHSIPFLGYFVVVAVCTAVIYYITPETKGKTFLEIQRKLNGYC